MRVPKICTHSSGQYRVTIRGKVHYLGVDKDEAERRYRKLITDHLAETPVDVAAPSITVLELVENFKIDQKQTTSPRWWDKKSQQLLQATEPLVRLYGNMPASYFGAKTFHTVRKEYSQVAGRSRKYVNSLANKMRQIFKWGVSQGEFPAEVFHRLESIPGLVEGELGLKDNEEIQPVSWVTVQETCEYLSGRNADLIQLLWETGMRPDELLSMEWEQIENGIYKPKNHKTERWNKRRVIPLNKKALAILKKYRKQGKLFNWLKDSHGLYTAVQRACTAGNIKKWHPYQIRHATVTRITLQHGKDVAQAVAGHSSIITTAIYDHSQMEKVKMLK